MKHRHKPEPDRSSTYLLLRHYQGSSGLLFQDNNDSKIFSCISACIMQINIYTSTLLLYQGMPPSSGHLTLPADSQCARCFPLQGLHENWSIVGKTLSLWIGNARRASSIATESRAGRTGRVLRPHINPGPIFPFRLYDALRASRPFPRTSAPWSSPTHPLAVQIPVRFAHVRCALGNSARPSCLWQLSLPSPRPLAAFPDRAC